jgi:hypothetical protein
LTLRNILLLGISGGGATLWELKRSGRKLTGLLMFTLGLNKSPTWGVRKVVSEAEVKALIKAGALWARFSGRISKLPEFLQAIFFEDLETAIENRLKALEAAR